MWPVLMGGSPVIDRLLFAHPRTVGESYFEHQRHALRFAAALLVAGLACAVHAVVPGVCAKTASRTVERLQARMARRGARAVDSTAVAAE
jgi:hypothetical protein